MFIRVINNEIIQVITRYKRGIDDFSIKFDIITIYSIPFD